MRRWVVLGSALLLFGAAIFLLEAVIWIVSDVVSGRTLEFAPRFLLRIGVYGLGFALILWLRRFGMWPVVLALCLMVFIPVISVPHSEEPGPPDATIHYLGVVPMPGFDVRRPEWGSSARLASDYAILRVWLRGFVQR